MWRDWQAQAAARRISVTALIIERMRRGDDDPLDVGARVPVPPRSPGHGEVVAAVQAGPARLVAAIGAARPLGSRKSEIRDWPSDAPAVGPLPDREIHVDSSAHGVGSLIPSGLSGEVPWSGLKGGGKGRK